MGAASDIEIDYLPSPPDARVFAAEYVARSRPVLIGGALDHWPARSSSRWTASRLRAHADAIVPLAPLRARGKHAFFDKSIEPAEAWADACETRPLGPAIPADVVRTDVLLAVACEREHRPLSTLLDAAARAAADGTAQAALGATAPTALEDADSALARARARGVNAADRHASDDDERSADNDDDDDGDGGRAAARAADGLCGYYADGAGNFDEAFGFLRGDVSPPRCARLLKLRRADVWLGGRSVSRMHFDSCENLFAQVVGSKRFVLMPPSASARMHAGCPEGRLRKAYGRRRRDAAQAGGGGGDAPISRRGGFVSSEAVLNYWPTNLRVTVAEGDAELDAMDASTCAVDTAAAMRPPSARCADEPPRRAAAPRRAAGERRTLRAVVTQRLSRPSPSSGCTGGDGGGDCDGGLDRLPAVAIDVRAGELLYLPFGWWHEVYSLPDCSAEGGGLCASVSHIYTPFFCRLRGTAAARLGPIGVNPAYRVLANACAQGVLVRRTPAADATPPSGSGSDDDSGTSE